MAGDEMTASNYFLLRHFGMSDAEIAVYSTASLALVFVLYFLYSMVKR